MNNRLNFDLQDPNYVMLTKIFKIIDSRPIHQIFARNGIKPIPKFCEALKLMFISLYFEKSLPDVVDDINSNKKLQKKLGIKMVLTADQINELMGRFKAEQIENSVNSIINKLRKSSRLKNHIYIVDATPADVDLNFSSKKITKKSLENKDIKWGKGTSIGFYIGFKSTFVLDYRTKLPVCFLIHPGSPNDAFLFEEILSEMKRRKLLRFGDIILFDRGYYSYENYKIGLKDYNIIPLILARKNFRVDRIPDALDYTLDYFNSNKKYLNSFNQYAKLVRRFLRLMSNRERIKYIRSTIEDFFKFLKEGLGMKHFHKYTEKSVKKTTLLTVLLGSLIIYDIKPDKKRLQRLAEGYIN